MTTETDRKAAEEYAGNVQGNRLSITKGEWDKVAIESFLAGITYARTPKWISVKDTLPEQNYDCWIFIPSNDGQKVFRAWWFGNDGVFGQDQYSCFSKEAVTHWCLVETPRPMPPTTEGEG